MQQVPSPSEERRRRRARNHATHPTRSTPPARAVRAAFGDLKFARSLTFIFVRISSSSLRFSLRSSPPRPLRLDCLTPAGPCAHYARGMQYRGRREGESEGRANKGARVSGRMQVDLRMSSKDPKLPLRVNSSHVS